VTLSRPTIWVLAALILLALAGGGYYWYQRDDAPVVTAEAIRRRDLEAVVSASGTIQPKRSVNISANTMGRVTKLAVEEGDRVSRGQFLLQIDPEPLRSAVQRSEASVEGARAALKQAQAATETAQAALELARTNLKRQQELWKELLTTRDALDRAQSDVTVRETELQAREQEVAARQQHIRQELASLQSNRYELSKVTIDSPIDGIVTRRSIEEGETVVIGTMNNAGTVLLTIADMSVIEAQVEVDETNVPIVALTQPARVTVDALADRTFTGRVTEIGNSPIQQAATGGQSTSNTRQATNFKVSVTLDQQITDVRPGFTCTADITTATRSKALAVPIQAVTVRDVIYDRSGQIVRRPRRDPDDDPPAQIFGDDDLAPGQSRKESEGVFVFRDGAAWFTPIKVGIAGDRYFESLSGVNEGDRVLTGPFESIRQLVDGDRVTIGESGGQ
jgi:HlyD family secretion protein